LSGGGAVSLVGVLLKESSNINQKRPQKCYHPFRRKNWSRANPKKQETFFFGVAERSKAVAGRVSSFSARKRFVQRI